MAIPTEVYELCPHCGNEAGLLWDIKKYGLHAFCPDCGERLMLCSECPATTDHTKCDYDSETDKCSMQKGEKK